MLTVWQTTLFTLSATAEWLHWEEKYNYGPLGLKLRHPENITSWSFSQNKGRVVTNQFVVSELFAGPQLHVVEAAVVVGVERAGRGLPRHPLHLNLLEHRKYYMR